MARRGFGAGVIVEASITAKQRQLEESVDVDEGISNRGSAALSITLGAACTHGHLAPTLLGAALFLN